MFNTVGDRRPPLAATAPDNRRFDAGRRRLPGQRSARPPLATATPMVALVADPLRDGRERRAAALFAAGASRVLQADSVEAVEALIDDASGGHLALISLGFGAATSRLIGGLVEVPWSRVIVLALSTDPTPLLTALGAGATGILRGSPGSAGPPPALLDRLTPREIEVLTLVAEGRSNKSIAESLELSALTVKSHLSRISRKLGTGDRSHQVAVAMRAGVLR